MKKYIMIMLALAGIVCPAFAQDFNEAQVKQKINLVASKMQTMQCNFVQTKYLKMLNDKMVSHGKMYYRQSDKLRWEYTSPYAYIFILNGTKVLLKREKHDDIIDVRQNKIFKEIARIMMNSVVGKCFSDNKDFHVSIASSASDWITTLLPQHSNMKQMFQKIIIHFNKQRSMVSRVELYEKNGDRTVIDLKNVLTNAPVNAKLFAIN